jgi:hypothetical protein
MKYECKIQEAPSYSAIRAIVFEVDDEMKAVIDVYEVSAKRADSARKLGQYLEGLQIAYGVEFELTNDFDFGRARLLRSKVAKIVTDIQLKGASE